MKNVYNLKNGSTYIIIDPVDVLWDDAVVQMNEMPDGKGFSLEEFGLEGLTVDNQIGKMSYQFYSHSYNKNLMEDIMDYYYNKDSMDSKEFLSSMIPEFPHTVMLHEMTPKIDWVRESKPENSVVVTNSGLLSVIPFDKFTKYIEKGYDEKRYESKTHFDFKGLIFGAVDDCKIRTEVLNMTDKWGMFHRHTVWLLEGEGLRMTGMPVVNYGFDTKNLK